MQCRRPEGEFFLISVIDPADGARIVLALVKVPALSAKTC